ncbi:hypothetical protein [Amycolatopsis alkalitolerans]|uniref:hypothetical protein n=1 Tax=Amycolatopsis alkalitolerans TaxID=2547244 RepID=UPI001F2305BC|nr:hypothetical protein [Amycolatopsis alkalitolerans]
MASTAIAGTRHGPRAMRATLLGVSTMTIMASATITPALPETERHFAAQPQAELLVRLVLTLPGLAIMLSAPPLARLSVRWAGSGCSRRAWGSTSWAAAQVWCWTGSRGCSPDGPCSASVSPGS